MEEITEVQRPFSTPPRGIFFHCAITIIIIFIIGIDIFLRTEKNVIYQNLYIQIIFFFFSVTFLCLKLLFVYPFGFWREGEKERVVNVVNFGTENNKSGIKNLGEEAGGFKVRSIYINEIEARVLTKNCRFNAFLERYFRGKKKKKFR